MSKRNSQLVCEYMENISREMLEEHQQVIRDFVGRRSGVYALYRHDKLYYVGLASSLLGRLKGHLRDRHGQTWDRFSVYLTIGSDHMKEIESLLLRIAAPPGNKVKGKFTKANNLLRRVKAEYRRREKERQKRLFGPRRKPIDGEAPIPSVSGAAVLATYAGKIKRLRAKHKGKTLWARVLKDGRVSFKGKRYDSPSKAAAKACGRRTCNGWWFWFYEKAPGYWVRLRDLRG